MRARIHSYLLERPAGATARELLDLVFTQPGADAEFGPHFIRTLLSGDPRFVFRDSDQCWVANDHAMLATALRDTEFVVVDLETTGGSPQHGHAIIEIGAVRIDRARHTQRFGRLVNPGRSLPPFITGLTGISDEMLADQPRIAEVLEEFLEFVGDRVLVAHNARFDIGFLDTALQQCRGHSLHQPHLCTLRLARRLVPTLRRRGLDAVAAHFGIPLVDRHRALGDAAITAEIFAHYLELLTARGIDRLDQVLALQSSARDGRLFVCPLPRAAVTSLPETPGIYRFFDADERLLYIGKAKNLRQRVGQYLSNAHAHSNKTLDLIRHIHSVEVAETGSELGAALTEAEAIRAEQPPYNRLRKHLPRIAFIRLTNDPEFPRLLITGRPPAGRNRSGGRYFSPFRSRDAAQRAIDVVTRLFHLRTCAGRLHPDSAVTPCWRGQISICSAPCAQHASGSQYAAQVAAFLQLMAGDAAAVAAARERLTRERAAHTEALRFEAAARAQRDLEQLDHLLRRQRTLGWIVAQHHFLVLQPSDRHDAALAYLVVAGRLVERAKVQCASDLQALAARARAQIGSTRGGAIQPDEVDGATILAAWLRDRGERDGFVFRVDDASAATDQLPEWAAALAAILPVTNGATTSAHEAAPSY